MASKEQIEAHVLKTYGIAPRQIYQDLDKREQGRRFIIVHGVTLKADKASCATCDSAGMNQGKTTWISFKRLSNPAYYKQVV